MLSNLYSQLDEWRSIKETVNHALLGLNLARYVQWRSQDFFNGGGGGSKSQKRGRVRKIYENSCIKMAFFCTLTCNCRVGVYGVTYVYWLRPIPYPVYLLSNQRGGGAWASLCLRPPPPSYAIWYVHCRHPFYRSRDCNGTAYCAAW